MAGPLVWSGKVVHERGWEGLVLGPHTLPYALQENFFKWTWHSVDGGCRRPQKAPPSGDREWGRKKAAENGWELILQAESDVAIALSCTC